MSERLEQLKRRNVRPTTPGAFLRDSVLPDLGISQGELSRRIEVSRRTINDLLLEKRSMSADMAWRIGKLLGNGTTFWLEMQRNVDAWDALHVDTSKYEFIEPLRKTA